MRRLHADVVGSLVLMPTLPVLLLLNLASLLAGFVDAIVGGGGLITVPALMLGLPAGTALPTLLGTNKFDAEGKLNNKIYRRGASGFHTDGNYEEEPFKATQLYALAIPSRGGDTYFASMYTAYDSLPEQLKKRLEGKYGIYVYGGRRTEYNTLLTKDDFNTRKPVRHPILGTHRETGRKVLYFDSVKINRIEGLEADESNALIDELAGCMTPHGTQYTHKWQKGDIVIWDNRCSYHKAAGDYPPEEDRIHWRVSIKEPKSAS